jgi:transposase
MSRTAIKINLDTAEQALLQAMLRKLSIPEFQKERVQIVLAASTGLQNKDIATQYGFEENRVGKWRKRWAHAHQQWQNSDTTLRPPLTQVLVFQWLADKKGRGRKEDFTSDQRSKIVALCQEHPEQHGFPVTHWSAGRLVQAAIKRGIVNTISERTMNRILKKRLVAPSKSILSQCQDRRS